jgi:hypothetical protein
VAFERVFPLVGNIGLSHGVAGNGCGAAVEHAEQRGQAAPKPTGAAEVTCSTAMFEPARWL